jgi:EAL domain-containing protein (putative c-di-GMP-specific phosphodiesterase class I)
VDQGLPLTTMAVNVSAMQFRDDGFVGDLFAILDETGLDPKYLEIELTESVLMHRVEYAATILQSLRNKGVVVSVDDFGTGYSSLSYLQKLPIDALKIDQSFVHHLTDNKDYAAIVIAIINMGHSLNLHVIAEGVETAEDRAFLEAHDCNEAQGDYFSKPVPAEEFANQLKVC